MIRHKEGLREAVALYTEIGGKLEASTYRNILQSYYAKAIDAIILDNVNYKLNYLGYIYIGKVKPKLQMWDKGIKPTMPVDWPSTKKYGKIIYHTNTKRFGYVFRIKWSKSKFKDASMFKFKPSVWTFKRHMSKLLQDENIKIDAPLLR